MVEELCGVFRQKKNANMIFIGSDGETFLETQSIYKSALEIFKHIGDNIRDNLAVIWHDM